MFPAVVFLFLTFCTFGVNGNCQEQNCMIKSFIDASFNKMSQLIRDTESAQNASLVIEEAKKEITKLKAITKTLALPPNNSAFYARLLNHLSLNSSSKKIYFRSVKTNVGGDYNSVTSVFTCRIPGTYSFQQHTLAMPGKLLQTRILKNYKEVAMAYARTKVGAGHYGVGATSCIINLNKGDKVWIEPHNNLFSTGSDVAHSLYTTFSGHLLFQS